MRLARWVLPPLLLARLAQAGPQLERSVGDRTREADRIVLVEVLDSQVRVPQGDVHQMTTVTTLVVREGYKGDGPARLEVVQLGGTYGLWEAHVAGDAHFEVGETALVFLRCKDPSQPARCSVVGHADGKLTVERVPAGQQVVSREGRRPIESVVDEIRRTVGVARPLSGGAK